MKRRKRNRSRMPNGMAGQIVQLETRRLLAAFTGHEIVTFGPGEVTYGVYVEYTNLCSVHEAETEETEDNHECSYTFNTFDFDVNSVFARNTNSASGATEIDNLFYQLGETVNQPTEPSTTEPDFPPLKEIEKSIETGIYFAKPAARNEFAANVEQPPEKSGFERLTVQPLLAVIPPGEATPDLFGSFQLTQKSDNVFGFGNGLNSNNSVISSLGSFRSVNSIYEFQHTRPSKAAETFAHQDLDDTDRFYEQLNDSEIELSYETNIYSLRFLRLQEGPLEAAELKSRNAPQSSLQPLPITEAKTETSKKERLSQQIQVVESAVVLLGLPSSRLCRDDELNDLSERN